MPSEQPIGKIKSAKSRLPPTRRVLTVLKEIETLLRQSDAILNGPTPIMPEEEIFVLPDEPEFAEPPIEAEPIEDPVVNEEDDKVRLRAKLLGIKRWNVKGLDKLREEIRQHGNAEHGEHEHGH
jgi:hypothetical protein